MIIFLFSNLILCEACSKDYKRVINTKSEVLDDTINENIIFFDNDTSTPAKIASKKALVIGEWECQKVNDLRTEEEKKLNVDIKDDLIEIEGGKEFPNITFFENNEYLEYYSKEVQYRGAWKVLNQNYIILNIRAKIMDEEKSKKTIQDLLKKNLLEKRNDGFYYFTAKKIFKIDTVNLQYLVITDEYNIQRVYKRSE